MTRSPTRWRKSSRSSDNGQCVEVTPGLRKLRDSKNPGGDVLTFSRTAAERFSGDLKTGRFDA